MFEIELGRVRRWRRTTAGGASALLLTAVAVAALAWGGAQLLGGERRSPAPLPALGLAVLVPLIWWRHRRDATRLRADAGAGHRSAEIEAQLGRPLTSEERARQAAAYRRGVESVVRPMSRVWAVVSVGLLLKVLGVATGWLGLGTLALAAVPLALLLMLHGSEGP